MGIKYFSAKKKKNEKIKEYKFVEKRDRGFKIDLKIC